MGAQLTKPVNPLSSSIPLPCGSRSRKMINQSKGVPGSESIAKLCEICSKLDISRLSHPLYPCRKPLPCSTPPVNEFGIYLTLGSVDTIKSRRSACDVCKLVADCLDKEPEGLDGECRITESAEFCNFKLPTNVIISDPSFTHIHLTQANVIFDPKASRFEGPVLPWEIKERDTKSSHYILNFQVKAKLCIDAKYTPTSPLMEDEFLDTIGGRHVGTQVNTQLIRAWLTQCESEHGKQCIPSVELPQGINKQPTFVIDVIRSCLVDTPPECRYVALSYVWGTAPVFRHLTENTNNLRHTGALRSLPIPATIRDSMTLVHAVGEHYLWVDSICIIQDDLKMQQEEITRMAAIYSKALFTIIAVSGDNANSGLPGVELGSREQAQKVLRLGGYELLTVIDVRKTRSGIEDTIWDQRAWTFQERILSNRILVFSGTQAYWSCHLASHSEENALEKVLDIDRLHRPFPERPSTDTLSWEPLEPSDYSDVYDDLLSTYRQRRLTYQTDLLNAFNGVSQILGALQNDAFLWGLPKSLFSYALTWTFTGHSSRNNVEVPIFQSDGSKQSVPFPSWSWAAWSCRNPKDAFLHGGESSHIRPVIQFYIVNEERQLMEVKERTWEDQTSDSAHDLWQDQRSHPLPSLPQYHLLQIGQLHFWTSCANVAAIRRQRVNGGHVEYMLFPPADYQPDPRATHYHSELVQQDFIVIAACNPKKLLLLAIEWKDGIAYREGQTEVKEAEWVGIENKEWRLITLG